MVGIVLVAACALLGVGAVAVVALITLGAHVLGSSLLDWIARDASGQQPPETPCNAMRILAGSCLWIGLIGATMPLKVHYGAFYLVIIAATLAAFAQRTREAIVSTRNWLTRPVDGSAAENVWIVVLGVVVVLHLFVVAKPEVGYDASAMHLQFAELIGRYHRWSFDVGRYAWAVMPLGADYAYLSAYLLGGERAARLLNLVFGALLCALVFTLIRRHSSRQIALGSVCLLASTPLAFTETGSLYVELAWTAFLVAGLAGTVAFAERASPGRFAAAALALAGAMQCKVMGAFWVLPVGIFLFHRLLRMHRYSAIGTRVKIICLLASTIAAWPYANAWMRTGNPVFPFMNALFRSPLFDSTTSFNNILYNAPWQVRTPYDLVLSSGRYIEGVDGAMGTQWLLLLPVVVVGLLTHRARMRFAMLALMLGFGAAVYAQQSYLRYLIPAFVLFAIIAAWTLDDWMHSAVARAIFTAAGVAAVAANLLLMPAASSSNTTLCLTCSQDRAARATYLAQYSPLRVVADYLNRNLPDARVGFLVFNAPAPSGFVGYSRSANWHDVQAYSALQYAASADDVMAVVRRFRLTHAVFAEHPADSLDHVLLEFRDRHTVPVARLGGYVIAAIRKEDN